MKIYRQGDVLVRPVDIIPSNKVKTNKICLALGEATGHHHSIFANDCEAIGYADKEDMLCSHFTVKEPVEIVHQEHASITLPKGDYEVILQTEYSPMEISRVRD